MGRSERAQSLRRAVGSIGESAPGVDVETLVILNGQSCDPTVLAWLTGSPLRLERITEASAGRSLTEGFARAGGRWVLFLDDDDQLLPDALARALRRAESSDNIDLLVCDGEFHERDGVRRLLTDFPDLERDPMSSFLRGNWLAPSGALYRRDQLSSDIFRDLPAFFEWSLVAFRLCLRRVPLSVHDEPLYAMDRGRPDSLSKSLAYALALPSVIEQMRSETSDPAVREALGRRLSAAHHDCAVSAARRGERLLAWRHHLAALQQPGGLRYLLFTRRLLPGGRV